jgi:hypothetical protein
VKKYRVFTIHPLHGLDMVLDSEAEARAKAASWKQTYPNVPVYMEPIYEL